MSAIVQERHSALGSRSYGESLVFLLTLASFAMFIYVSYSIFLSSLSKFPGPVWAKVSPSWLVKQSRATRRTDAVMSLHKHYGNFVRIAPNHISINVAQAAHEVYGHKTGFLKADFYDVFVQVKPGLFNTREVEVHQRKRKFLNPAFSARALREFEPHMDEEIRLWKSRMLDMTTGTSAKVDFSIWSKCLSESQGMVTEGILIEGYTANYLAFDVIGSFSFGKPFGFIQKGYDAYGLIQTIDERGEVFNALGSVPSFLRPFMKYYRFDSFWKRGAKAKANFEDFCRRAYLERKHGNSCDRRDLLSYLLAAKDPDTGTPLPEEEIIAESISFVVGGSDTTSSTMTNFIDFVSRDKELLERIQKELDTQYPGPLGPDWVADNDTASTLLLLNSTLREVMRIRPTSATGLERVTPKGGRIIAGTFIQEGTIVSVPTQSVMQDANIFPDPLRLLPERWLDANSETLLRSFIPFSIGPRACIGRNFAWMEAVKGLATVLRLFDLHRTIQAETEVREGFFKKAAECVVELSRRSRF
ncbi:hypothetical protein PENFLA_c072G04756 [Penicillium flavigenum]|uniref:Cytochrome P450 n=1 Tax=Penicillium flavigenum TaxID=254877 RepID=A0A1V6SBB0_9EURO|nr:hypothetical protein PENFLA_c072G04756 [Penicillium flavigenum]